MESTTVAATLIVCLSVALGLGTLLLWAPGVRLLDTLRAMRIRSQQARAATRARQVADFNNRMEEAARLKLQQEREEKRANEERERAIEREARQRQADALQRRRQAIDRVQKLAYLRQMDPY